jgi:iron(III) transport system permease protein
MNILRKVPGFVLLFFLVGYVGYPFAMMISRSLSVEGSLSFQRYLQLLDPSNQANLEAIVNSVGVSLLSVLTSAIVGSVLALVLTQMEFVGKGVLARLAILPIGLPPLVGAIAVLLAFGDSGVVPRLANEIGFLGMRMPGLSGFSGILAVHTYSFSVYFYMLVAAALRKFDGAQMEAAATLGAGPWQIIRHILIPGLRPSFLGASMLTFMASMASFTAPLLFAGERRFLTLQIYFTKLNGDLDMAAAQSVMLAAVSVLFFILARGVTGEQTSRAATKGVSRKAQIALPSPVRRLAIVVAYSLIALSMLPFVVIVLLSFAKEGSWTWQILPQEYTMQNYLGFVSDPHMYEPVLNSTWMALTTMLVAGCAGLGIAWGVYRNRARKVSRFVEVLLSSPYAFPGTVVAIALIQAYGGLGPINGQSSMDHGLLTIFGGTLVGTVWILPLAYVIRTYPLVLQPASAALEVLDPVLPEAAASLGSSRMRTFWSIVLPAIRPAVLSGVLLAGIMAIGEFVASVLLYSYDTRPISMEIFSQLRMFNIGSAAAYSVVLLFLVLGMVAVHPDREVERM